MSSTTYWHVGGNAQVAYGPGSQQAMNVETSGQELALIIEGVAEILQRLDYVSDEDREDFDRDATDAAEDLRSPQPTFPRSTSS